MAEGERVLSRLHITIAVLIAVAAVMMGAVTGRGTLLDSEASNTDHIYVAEKIRAETEESRSWVTAYQEYLHALRYAQHAEHAAILQQEIAWLEGQGEDAQVHTDRLSTETGIYYELAAEAQSWFYMDYLGTGEAPGELSYVYDVKARHDEEMAETMAIEHLDPDKQMDEADMLHSLMSSIWFLLIPVGVSFFLFTMAEYALDEADIIEARHETRRRRGMLLGSVLVLIALGAALLLASTAWWLILEL